MTVVLPTLERRLRREVKGDVLFSRFDRGRYATDASSYQMTPAGIVVPETMEGALAALELAREEGLSVTPRGGGTSQCGQTVNETLVVDTSKHLNKIISLDVAAARCIVQPGIVLDELNRQLKPHGLWFPVDVSTASRATIGGMAGNNSCGGRSLRYGTMRDNVVGIDAVLADGGAMHFGEVNAGLSGFTGSEKERALFSGLLDLGTDMADEVAARFPKVQRRVGGYNLDALVPNAPRRNMADILVGSEGTLAFSTAIELKLWSVLGRRGLGVCHFGSFYKAMDAAQHLVTLKPIAVELVDRTMLDLAGAIAMFKPTLEQFVRGRPQALLLVEFAEDDTENRHRLMQLHDMMAQLGFGWDKPPQKWGGVVDVLDAGLQGAIADLRTSGLNIMMSMKDAGKPVSFIEDCAVPLPHLAEYTEKLTKVFAKHGTSGTWYAHASEGCLHVRPVLNLKLDKDLKAMRAIAEEAFALVREYKGSHSGEHGDGIVRSEFHEQMFGPDIVTAFGTVKKTFDPEGLFNPGKIVDPPRFDDRNLLRYNAAYHFATLETVLDWSAYTGGGGGFQGAVEMCNNNGACRKLHGGVMCPSYRVTMNERDVTRGRANTLRLAISGQLGADAFASDEMAETMKLCVSCKACRRECPTGVDMARMKIEVQAARTGKNGISLRDRLIAYLPRYAPLASRLPWLFNLRDKFSLLAALSERLFGLAASRSLPQWRADLFSPDQVAFGPENGREVVLLADTFNRYQEPENLKAALGVLVAAGYRVHLPEAVDGGRPLCCGRTFLATGLIDQAKAEAERSLTALTPFAARGVPIIGLEPSCLFSFRDEIPALMKDARSAQVSAQTFLFEEFVAREAAEGHFAPALKPIAEKALLHGHCHQKAFGAMGAVEKTLRLVPGLAVETIESSCCGMAGAFGYQSETFEASKAMAELSLMPAVRAADVDTLIVADGTSCRHQIADLSSRKPLHVARVLEMAIAGTGQTVHQ